MASVSRTYKTENQNIKPKSSPAEHLTGTRSPWTNERSEVWKALITEVAVISKLSSELEHGLSEQRFCLWVAWPLLLAADF